MLLLALAIAVVIALATLAFLGAASEREQTATREDFEARRNYVVRVTPSASPLTLFTGRRKRE